MTDEAREDAIVAEVVAALEQPTARRRSFLVRVEPDVIWLVTPKGPVISRRTSSLWQRLGPLVWAGLAPLPPE